MEDKPKRRGRPRKEKSDAVYTAQLCVLMTPETKEWVLDHGGSELVRRLISDEQQRLGEASSSELEATSFYAVEHTFSPEIRDLKGWYIGFAYRFTTQASRDAFVKTSPKREAVDDSVLLNMGYREEDIRDGEAQ